MSVASEVLRPHVRRLAGDARRRDVRTRRRPHRAEEHGRNRVGSDGEILLLLGVYLREHPLGLLFNSDNGYRCFADDPGKLRRPDSSVRAQWSSGRRPAARRLCDDRPRFGGRSDLAERLRRGCGRKNRRIPWSGRAVGVGGQPAHVHGARPTAPMARAFISPSATSSRAMACCPAFSPRRRSSPPVDPKPERRDDATTFAEHPKMCGIVGYTGGHEASPILVAGLRRLEYRGYDMPASPRSIASGWSCGRQRGGWRLAGGFAPGRRCAGELRHQPYPLGHARSRQRPQRPPARRRPSRRGRRCSQRRHRELYKSAARTRNARLHLPEPDRHRGHRPSGRP